MSLNALAQPFYPRSTEFNLTIITVNCRSVVNKVAELVLQAEQCSPDIICLTETWLTAGTPLHVPGYLCHRRDRPTDENRVNANAARGYGGVAILVRENVFTYVKPRIDLCQPQCESVWLELGSQQPGRNEKSLLVACYYRPPSTSGPDINHFCSQLEDSLQMIDLSSRSVVLTGDFNARHSDWYGSDTISTAGIHLSNVFSCFGLTQSVSFPTYVTPSTGLPSACLDLFVTNRPGYVQAVDFAAPLGASDHLQVVCNFTLPGGRLAKPSPNTSFQPAGSEPNSQFSRKRYNFRHVSSPQWAAVNGALSMLDWKSVIHNHDVDVAVHNFMEVLNSVFDSYLSTYPSPSTGSAAKRRRQYPPWVNTNLRQAIKRKHDLHSQCRKYPTPANILAYNSQRNRVRALSRYNHREYVRSIKSSLSTASRCPTLHQFVRDQRRQGTEVSIPPLLSPLGVASTQDSDKASLLNQYFASVAVADVAGQAIPSLSPSPSLGSQLTAVHTSTSLVRRAISNLKAGKSPGMDGITNDVLKKLSPSISYPLCLLFNLSYTTGTFPSVWKTGKIIPIYKGKGPRTECSNYRPISLLSAISKLCERLFYNILYSHVSPALSGAQSGFRRGDSTSLQLTRLMQDIASLRDDRQHVAVCYFDLAKAFDTVWHRALLYKLATVFKIGGQCLNWLRSYLTNRQQFVFLNGSSSPLEPVLSGVPQGS